MILAQRAEDKQAILGLDAEFFDFSFFVAEIDPVAP